ncbi:MAG TPA: cupin domain-containing protein [Baekduia sp.]|nr:cupin domain-containing protein [Baekduia sp.]
MLTAGELVESQGFRYFSIAPTGHAPQIEDQARVLYRAPDGLTVTSYEAHAQGLRFIEPAASVWETFYVIEGSIACRPSNGAAVTFKTGDLGYRSWEDEAELIYSDRLRVIRFFWANDELPPQTGNLTTGPLGAKLSAARSTENTGLNSLHVFGDQGPSTIYHERPATVRPVDLSPDGRHMSFYGMTPEGVRFRELAGNLGETFYLVQGEVRCTPTDTGETIEWKAGDLVYWPYDREFDLEYSAGMGCVCWFWSDERLPDFTSGANAIEGRS